MMISADSHVVEPFDLWVENLPRAWRDRAPRAERNPDNHHWYFVDPDGFVGVDLTLSTTAGMSNVEVQELLDADPDALVGRGGGADPVARLRDLWSDETVADVMYPTAALSLFPLTDVELQQACFTVYNDWLADLCRADPARLAGLGLLSTWNIDHAVDELTRCAELGLRGAVIWTSPPDGESFFDPRYEPLWRAAAELAMPLSLHTLGGLRASREIAGYGRTVPETFFFGFTSRLELQRSVCELIVSGVFARHPDLRVVAAEGGIDYAATLERRLDGGYRSSWGNLTDAVPEKPSTYFRRNVFCTYIDDPVGLNNVRFTGADHFCWSGDYPHGAASWPASRAQVDARAAEFGFDDETVKKLTVDNVAGLYRFDLATIAEPSPLLR